MEAEKVKKKVNGAILKGRKVKVEEARPKKRKHGEETGSHEEHNQVVESTSGHSETVRKDKGSMTGHQIGHERKVKRGWTQAKTEPSTKKQKITSGTKPQAPSKFTEGEELLFKTKIPENKIMQNAAGPKKKGKKESINTVVHEFEKSTTVPSFLRITPSDGKTAVAYEDGKGWIDEQGGLVEGEDTTVSRRRDAAQHGAEAEVPAPVKRSMRTRPVMTISVPDRISATSRPSPVSSSIDDTDNTSDREASSADGSGADETSSSGSSGSGTESESLSASDVDATTETARETIKATKPKSSIHPLEALFKKPVKPASSQPGANSQDIAKPSLEVQTSFSFFESHEDADTLPPMPATPFSSQDLHTRVLRSAAPTPDTAHPSRMNSVFDGESSDGELSEMEDDKVAKHDPAPYNQTLPGSQTDFEKKFWEKRGENNRAWKARRRTVLKEKRQRENRARRPRNW